jgi:CheY-like chemotaxis protein
MSCILLLESHRSATAFLLPLLRGAGYTVVESDASPESLQEVVSTTVVSLVIADVSTPTSCFEAAVKLQSQIPHLKILFLSGHTHDRWHGPEKLAKLNPASYYMLTKPFTWATIQIAINNLCGHKAAKVLRAGSLK